MIFTAYSDGSFALGGARVRCALGRGGVVAAAEKREGDGATPLGLWPLRRLLYRADRLTAPSTRLSATALAPDDGWCDAPFDEQYNRPVRHPHSASAERLWRQDAVYDLIVPLGYNDAPPVPGRGSAIFLHLARPAFEPTEGCVALSRPDLERLLAEAGPNDSLEIVRA